MGWLEIELENTKELDQMIAGMAGFNTILNSPALVSRMVPAVAEEWAINFRIGGGYGTPDYARLSAQTERVRAARGHGNNRYAALYASGALYGGAIGQFLAWRTGQTAATRLDIPPTRPDVDIAESGPTAIAASVTKRQFKATISGAKAMHQTGGNMDFFGSEGITTYLPARPFWFFNQKGLDNAAQNVITYLINIGFYNMPNFAGVTRSVANASGPGAYSSPAGKGMWTGRR